MKEQRKFRPEISLQTLMFALPLLTLLGGGGLFVVFFYSHRSGHEFFFMTVGALLVTISMMFLGRWFSLKIKNQIDSISLDMDRFATGDFGVDISQSSDLDAFGVIAKTLKIFRGQSRERQRLETLIVSANKRTQKMIHSMNEGMLEIEAYGKIVRSNPAAERMLTAEPDTLIGRNIGEFLRGFGSDKEPILDSLLKIEDIKRLTCFRDDGSRLTASISCVALDSAESKQNYALVVLRDVTDLVANQHRIGQFKTVLDMVAADVYLIEPKSHGLIYMNNSALDRNSTSISEVCNLTVADIISTVDPITLQENLNKLEVSDQSTMIYLDSKRCGGSKIQAAEVHLQFINHDGKNPQHVVFVYDVTTKLETSRALRRFKDSLDATEDSVFMLRVDNLNFTYLNNKARALTGWSDQEYLNKVPEDLNPAFNKKRFRMLTKPLIFGSQKSIMLTTTGLDLKPVELTVELFDLNDTDPWFVVTTRDISKRVEIENENRVFRQTLDLSQDAISMIWPDTLTYLYQNHAAREISGWSPAEYRTKTIADMNPNFSLQRFDEQAKHLLDGTTKQVVFEALGKKDRPIEVTLELIRPEGAKERFVSISRDISERKAADLAKQEFVSTVSHELRTPLTSISGALGIIDAEAAGPLSAKQKSLISIALSNSNRLSSLVNDILDIEKFEAGKMEVDMDLVSLAKLVEDSVAANAQYANTHSVQFVTSNLEVPVFVRGEYDRLMQVMANLLSNAAKFSKAGDRIEVLLEKDGDIARVSVVDHGKGIPEAAQATIFEKFTQADSSDRRSKGGTGLGLNIAQKIVHAHGGKIDFSSVETKGTTFYFELDLAKDEEMNERAGSKAGKQQTKILVCEDDSNVAAFLQAMLMNAGYLADIANSGAEARKMLELENYDGMTLDLELPDENGLELLRDLRARPEFQSLPIFIVSATPQDGPKSSIGWGFGVVEWLTKPIDETKLVNALSATFDKSIGEVPRILHVEDDEDVIEIVSNILETKADVVPARNLNIARRRLRLEKFDLIILDLGLPDGRGETLLSILAKSKEASPPVLIFSGDEAPSIILSRVQGLMVKSNISNAYLLETVKLALDDMQQTKMIAAE